MKSKIFGYTIVSSKEQNEERQLVAFKEYGIDERDIYIDKLSGKDFNRENYVTLKHILRENDLLVIKSIDRLGRIYNQIIDEWKNITKNIKADIVVIDMSLLDTRKNKDLLGTFISDLVLQILSYVAEQEKRLKARCVSNDYVVYKVYTDAGISGKSVENRPAYQQMLKDMKKVKFNLIVAFKMDRLSRSIIDFEEIFNELKKYNCGIEFLCENIDTTGAVGMMFARILGIFAQFERELIKERILVGVESVVNKGHIGGKPPLGYKHKLDDSGKHKLKEWEIDKDEAEIVKEIFELYASGKTYFQISKILKEKYPNVISSIRINKETWEEKIIYRKWNDSSISRVCK